MVDLYNCGDDYYNALNARRIITISAILALESAFSAAVCFGASLFDTDERPLLASR